LGAEAIAVIALVHNRLGQRRGWRSLGKHRVKSRALMTLPGGEDYGNAGAFVATARMDFGG
jgi:hypothetical protein